MRFLSIVTISTLMIVGCASSEPAEPQTRANVMTDQLFDRLDRDADGFIETDEIEAARLRQFQRVDADGDGFLTSSEIETLRNDAEAQRVRTGERRPGRAGGDPLDMMDRDGDGRISASEFESREARLLSRADVNGDGRIARQEVDDVMARLQSRRRR